MADWISDDVHLEPLVLVVDHEPSRRQRLADAVRHAGGHAVEAATPLEAIVAVERGARAVTAVAVADRLTQTHGDELVGFLTEVHPELRLAVIGERAGAGDVSPGAVVLPLDGADATERVRLLVGPR
jgi:CheY-like chemotaxis protein